jgi:perosamine synthetase
MAKLAILGGMPVRTEPFMSRPHIDDNEKRLVNDCLEKKSFSRFIGSPSPDFRKHLSLSSKEVVDLKDFWSVLGGEYVRRFEGAFAQKHGAAYAVCMNSATSCLTAGLIASGVQPGDEVVTTPFSFTATATAVALMGAKVKFADVDPQTYCMDISSLKAAVTEKTKAVIPVHLLGNAGHIVEISEFCRQEGMALIEDSAQALHARKNGTFLGTFGDIGVFSFQETKNIMTGEGGMAITNDPELAYRLRLIRNHGEAMVFDTDPSDRIRAALGYNFRLPEILAALGYAQVQKLEFLNGIRKDNYEFLIKALGPFAYLRPQRVTNDQDEFYPYCIGIRFDLQEFGVHRDLFAQALRAEGIPVSTGFPRLLNENLMFDGNAEKTPVARELNYSFYLGFFQIGYPNTQEDMKDILSAIGKLTENRDELFRAKGSLSFCREYDSGRL